MKRLGSVFVTLASDATHAISQIPTLILIDELGYHKDRRLYNALDTGRGAFKPHYDGHRNERPGRITAESINNVSSKVNNKAKLFSSFILLHQMTIRLIPKYGQKRIRV